MSETKPPEPILYSVKEMAAALDKSEDIVTFMKKGGFKLPATKSEAITWMRENGPPTRFRLYKQPLKKKNARNKRESAR